MHPSNKLCYMPLAWMVALGGVVEVGEVAGACFIVQFKRSKT